MKDFSIKERLANIDVMMWQYIGIAFDLLEKIIGMMELRQELLDRENDTEK